MKMIEKFNKEECLDIYRNIRLGRRFEEKTIELGNQGEILGSIHAGIGMEAIQVGVSLALKEGDITIKTHRDHGQLIAEGVHPKYLFAELMGKIDGYNKGLGGSMHLPGISGVLGVPGHMAAGAALAFKLKKLNYVAVGQYGDGASNIGPLHEAINMAAIWKLPVVFLCENNQYAVSTSIKYSTLLENLSDRSKAYGIPGETVDGMDVMEVYKGVSKFMERARSGEGPAMLECKAYRYEDHSKSTAAQRLTYRTQEEIDSWKEKDPLKTWPARLIKEGMATEEDMKKIDAEVEKTMEESIEFAKASPLPDIEDAFKYMYATPYPELCQKGW
jgi:pyruvate dehydrogenase E1 component alpha subunit